MIRFNVSCGGFITVHRVYRKDGKFVDAEIAVGLLEALEDVIAAWRYGRSTDEAKKTYEAAIAALIRANKGEV